MINAPKDVRTLFFGPTQISYERLEEWLEREEARLTKELVRAELVLQVHRYQGAIQAIKELRSILSKGVSSPHYSATPAAHQ